VRDSTLSICPLLSICQQKVKMKSSLFAVALLGLVALAAAQVRTFCLIGCWYVFNGLRNGSVGSVERGGGYTVVW